MRNLFYSQQGPSDFWKGRVLVLGLQNLSLLHALGLKKRGQIIPPDGRTLPSLQKNNIGIVRGQTKKIQKNLSRSDHVALLRNGQV